MRVSLERVVKIEDFKEAQSNLRFDTVVGPFFVKGQQLYQIEDLIEPVSNLRFAAKGQKQYAQLLSYAEKAQKIRVGFCMRSLLSLLRIG